MTQNNILDLFFFFVNLQCIQDLSCVLNINVGNWDSFEHSLCRNPTLAKCEDEIHTPKVGDLESFGTPEPLELDNMGQNTSHWGVLYTIGKFLKCRCPKWSRMSHLDICSPSYGQKKGRESN